MAEDRISKSENRLTENDQYEREIKDWRWAEPQRPVGQSSIVMRDFPGGTMVKNPPANAGDMGSSPGLGRSYMPWSS